MHEEDEEEVAPNQCPFFREGENPDAHQLDIEEIPSSMFPRYKIVCTCGASGPRGLAEEAAIFAWNQRA